MFLQYTHCYKMQVFLSVRTIVSQMIQNKFLIILSSNSFQSVSVINNAFSQSKDLKVVLNVAETNLRLVLTNNVHGTAVHQLNSSIRMNLAKLACVVLGL